MCCRIWGLMLNPSGSSLYNAHKFVISFVVLSSAAV
uniref:Uncharacterized protein n=1 Tax=Arundo donax TaxID=35708 RepID=A0A0A9ARA6_ARUDO